jgi:hypothetical protein
LIIDAPIGILCILWNITSALYSSFNGDVLLASFDKLKHAHLISVNTPVFGSV